MDESNPLAALLHDADPLVRESLLSNPSLPTQILVANASSSDRSFRASVAANVSTPQEILTMLSLDKTKSVRRAVAANPSTPGDVLERLAADAERCVREAVAENSTTGSEVLRALTRASDEFLDAVAGNPSTPQDVLELLARRTTDDVWEALARNPSVPRGALREMLLHRALAEDSWKLSSFARHPSNPPEGLERLSQSALESVRKLVAANPNTPPSVVEILSRDKEYGVRESVIKNPNVSTTALEILARDDSWGIPVLVAVHESTPRAVVESLARHENAAVRLAARLNPSNPIQNDIETTIDNEEQFPFDTELGQMLHCGVTSIALLSGSTSEIGESCETPSTILESLAQDPESYIREQVAHNTSTPLEVLSTLARDSEKSVRAALAGNEAAALNLLTTLALDSETEVRAAVASNAAAVRRWGEDFQNVLSSELVVSSIPAVDHRASALPSVNWSIQLEGSHQQMWISSDGQWLAICTIAADEGLLYIIDAFQHSLLATLQLSDANYMRYSDLAVSWSEDEKYLAVVEHVGGLFPRDHVPVRVFTMDGMREVLNEAVTHPDGWDLRATGTCFSEQGDRLAVCFSDGMDCSDEPGISIRAFNLDSGDSITLMPWIRTNHEPVLSSGLTRCFLIVCDQFEEPDSAAIWVYYDDHQEIIELGTGPEDFPDSVWLSLDEQSLFVLLDSDSDSDGSVVVEVDLDSRRVSDRLAWDSQEPDYQHWSFPSEQPGSASVESPCGQWLYSFDETTRCLVVTPLGFNGDTGGTFQPSVSGDEKTRSRRYIPLELPPESV